MKMILLVLLFAGLVVNNKGLREQDDAEDIRVNKGLEREDTGDKRRIGFFPFSYMTSRNLSNRLNSTLQRIHGDAATRTKRLYSSLVRDWDNQTLKERANRAVALKVVADNIGAILHATKDDSTAAFLAVLNLMNTLKQLNSSNGGIDSIPAMFTSSCMNLFEKSSFYMYDYYDYTYRKMFFKETKNDVLDVIDKYYQYNYLLDDDTAQATTSNHYLIKMLLNSAGKDNDKISPHNASRLHVSIMKEYRFPLTDKLRKILTDTLAVNRGGYLIFWEFEFLELYIKLETIRKILLIHMLSLIPENSQSVIKFIQTELKRLKQNLLPFLNVVENHALGSQIQPHYDGQASKVTNAYMTLKFGLPMPDDFPGLSCITLSTSHHVPWKWYKLPRTNHPYFGAGGEPCKWRIVSHGQGLYSIVNKYDCPYNNLGDDWCDDLLSFDSGNPSTVTIEGYEPVLWKIRYNPKGKGYTIRTKRFCGNKCNCYLGYRSRTIKQTIKQFVGQLDCSTTRPKYWKIFKAPSSDMVTDSGSTATNQSSENQEDNSVSGDIAVDLSSDEDNGDNNFSGKSENEILEKSKPETAEQSNQDSTGNEIED